jgi:hypothetical protein
LKHGATASFWKAYEDLPPTARNDADAAFDLLKQNARHPSLRLKKVGEFWSVRVNRNHRALALENADGLVWIWIGNHAEYERLIR